MSGIARRPSHFAVLSTLLLAILAAYGLRDLFQRLGRRWQPWLLVGALLLIGLEYVPAPLLLLQPQVHPYYATLAGREGAVLDLPPRSESSEPMQAQLVHGRPIAGGYLSRLPSYPFAQHAPAVRNLWNIQQEAPDILHEDPVSGLVALQALGFRDVVVHWDELPPEKRESMALLLRDVLGEVAPSFEDGAVSFYQIPEIPAQPFVYTYWGKGWYRLEQEGERMWRWMSGAAEIHVDNPGPQTAGVFMRFHWQSYLHPRPVNISLDSRLLTQVQVPHANSSLELLIVLPKGEHLLSFQTESDPEPAYPNRELSLTCLGVEVTYLAGALP